MKSVLIVSQGFYYGTGAYVFPYNAAKKLATLGYDIHVLTRKFDKTQNLEKDFPEGINIYEFTSKKTYDVFNFKKWIKNSNILNLEYNFAWFHSSNLCYLLLKLFDKHFRNFPKLLTAYSSIVLEYIRIPSKLNLIKKKFLQYEGRFCSRKVDVIHFLTNYSKRNFEIGNKLELDSKYEVIYQAGGVENPKNIETSVSILDEQTQDDLNKGIPYFIVFRHLIRKAYNLEMILEAIRILKFEYSIRNFRVIFGGRGNDLGYFKNMSREMEVDDITRFLGFIPEEKKYSYYKYALATIMPTRHMEGFGISMLESFAVGTPVIATPIGGMAEFMMENSVEEGLLYEISPKALADKMKTILTEGNFYDKNKLVEIASKYSWENVTKNLLRKFWKAYELKELKDFAR